MRATAVKHVRGVQCKSRQRGTFCWPDKNVPHSANKHFNACSRHFNKPKKDALHGTVTGCFMTRVHNSEKGMTNKKELYICLEREGYVCFISATPNANNSFTQKCALLLLAFGFGAVRQLFLVPQHYRRVSHLVYPETTTLPSTRCYRCPVPAAGVPFRSSSTCPPRTCALPILDAGRSLVRWSRI